MKIGKSISTLLKTVYFLTLAVLLGITVRAVFFLSVVVPSDSMAPTIFSGEYIMVNKCVPGLRTFSFDSVKKCPLTDRKFRTGKIRRNDILVFNYPYHRHNVLSFDSKLYYIKRCVAVAGDTFSIENGIYRMHGVSRRLGNYEAQQRLSEADSAIFSPEVFLCYPQRSPYHWTIKNFVPLYIPRKGDCVPIDTVSIYLYKNLLEYETGQKIKINAPNVLLNDSIINNYTFSQNYYFMAGDRVFDSGDSRYWGLLPEDHIAGRAMFIWKSIDPQIDKIRWKRVGKQLSTGDEE
jgi:signal peptidase I